MVINTLCSFGVSFGSFGCAQQSVTPDGELMPTWGEAGHGVALIMGLVRLLAQAAGPLHTNFISIIGERRCPDLVPVSCKQKHLKFEKAWTYHFPLVICTAACIPTRS